MFLSSSVGRIAGLKARPGIILILGA